MNKKSKTKQHAKIPVSAQAANRKTFRLGVVFLASALMLVLGIWWWKSQFAEMTPGSRPISETNASGKGVATSPSEFEKLKGGWRRPDGGYVLAIKNIADGGAMDAAYFNPNPIHVANAVASQDGAATKVFVELRDVNYPGSTYKLTYDPERDRLRGIYYQAVERQRYEVVFERMK